MSAEGNAPKATQTRFHQGLMDFNQWISIRLNLLNPIWILFKNRLNSCDIQIAIFKPLYLLKYMSNWPETLQVSQTQILPSKDQNSPLVTMTSWRDKLREFFLQSLKHYISQSTSDWIKKISRKANGMDKNLPHITDTSSSNNTRDTKGALCKALYLLKYQWSSNLACISKGFL